MPRGDGTGPTGAGPMTGRAAGLCAGLGMPGFANFGAGGGMGRGRGGFFGGRGRRNMFYATGLTGWQRAAQANMPQPVPAQPVADTPTDSLRQQVETLQSQLDAMKSRLAVFEAEKA